MGTAPSGVHLIYTVHLIELYRCAERIFPKTRSEEVRGKVSDSCRVVAGADGIMQLQSTYGLGDPYALYLSSIGVVMEERPLRGNVLTASHVIGNWV